ncbi:MAG: transposase [Flavobacteriaceae bacterium]
MEFLEEEYFYHIYNRGNNKQNIFFEKENYHYFIRLLEKYISPIAEIYSYCLLPNHFHLLIKIKSGAIKPSQKFSNFFNSYTKSINKKYNRTGSLFQKPFKRIRVSDSKYLFQLVTYIHLNPENHNIIRNFEKYKYSSYSLFLNETYSSFIEVNEVLEWFDGITNFKFVHNQRRTIEENNLFAE